MPLSKMLRWMPAFALVTLVACDSPTEPDPLVVRALTLEAVGDAAQLEAGNTNDALPTWESLNPEIVTVTPAGMAVAVSAGTATVRARLGSRTDDGTVTVLPAVNVVVTDLAAVTSPDGAAGLSMRVRNDGGRGYFKLEYWRERADGETEHKRVLYYATDLEAPVGMDLGHQSFLGHEPADWVVAYSREPASTHYTMTGCVRLDGGTPCPMP